MANSRRLPEIDILRWIAIILMITSHFGAELVSQEIRESQPFNLIKFAGGWAPVMFFFVTGLGYGINYNKVIKNRYWFDVFTKAFILILVERVAFILNGNLIGIDFLSFIAIITVILSAFRAYRASKKTIILLIILLLSVRYFLGPIISNNEFSGVYGWLFGTNHLIGFSYPFSPWLVYPFLGYLLGTLITERSIDLKTFGNNYKPMAILVFISILSLVLINGWLRGYILFRWGTVSIDYFCCLYWH